MNTPMKGYLFQSDKSDRKVVYSTFSAAIEALLHDEGSADLFDYLDELEESEVYYEVVLGDYLYIEDGPSITKVELKLG